MPKYTRDKSSVKTELFLRVLGKQINEGFAGWLALIS